MTSFPKIKIIFLISFNYLSDQTSKMVCQLWVQCLNVLMQLFGNGFFIACRGQCYLVHHTFFFQMVEKERVMDKTLTMCFLS